MDFIQILMKIKSSHQDDSDLLEAFEVFDREKKGFFRLHELEDTFNKILGSDLTECELAGILQLADSDGDGRVNFEGLCEGNKNMGTPNTRTRSAHSRVERPNHEATAPPSLAGDIVLCSWETLYSHGASIHPGV